MPETELEMVQRHIISAEEVIDLQRVLIKQLQDRGHNSGPAEQLLAMFRKTLASHYRHLEELERRSKA